MCIRDRCRGMDREQWRGREREADRGNEGQIIIIEEWTGNSGGEEKERQTEETMDRHCSGMDRETISRDPGTGTRRQQLEETVEQLVQDGAPTTPSRVKGARQGKTKTKDKTRQRQKQRQRQDKARQGKARQDKTRQDLSLIHI